MYPFCMALHSLFKKYIRKRNFSYNQFLYVCFTEMNMHIFEHLRLVSLGLLKQVL